VEDGKKSLLQTPNEAGLSVHSFLISLLLNQRRIFTILCNIQSLATNKEMDSYNLLDKYGGFSNNVTVAGAKNLLTY